MARTPNDGRGRLGGRRPGSKNKPKKSEGSRAADLLRINRELAASTWEDAKQETLAIVFALLGAVAEIGRLADAVAALAPDKTTEGK